VQLCEIIFHRFLILIVRFEDIEVAAQHTDSIVRVHDPTHVVRLFFELLDFQPFNEGMTCAFEKLISERNVLLHVVHLIHAGTIVPERHILVLLAHIVGVEIFSLPNFKGVRWCRRAFYRRAQVHYLHVLHLEILIHVILHLCKRPVSIRKMPVSENQLL